MTKQQGNSQQKPGVSKQQLIKLVFIPVLMFGFGFALVPLYDVFCEVTGLNGKTGRVEAATLQGTAVDESRQITVKFIANEGTGLPWTFEPLVKEMVVHPGKVYEASYLVRNSANRPTFGQAVPSVSPVPASRHFNKTECFCFTRQELKARESREMPLRFVITHELPEEIVEVTLSYTFFDVENKQG